MLRTLSLRLAAVATMVASVVAPSALNAQKALVYCPVGIDAGGCTTIVAALAADATRFPDGADAGYDGTQGTLDLAAADFSSYAVFVVPSLADGPDAQPYALLRNGTIAARLKAAFVGRVAVWSGTPDVGSTNRSSKDALIRNLAGWARPDAAGTHGPGVVALQDNSDDGAARYGWLSAISAMSVSADTTFDVYSNVQVLTSTGQTILTSGGLQLGYTNMASYGLVANGASQDATGARTSRVVLATVAGDPSDPNLATINTDKDDYQPGDTVTVTGAGWEPGETVSLLFHEDVDPPIHPDKTFTSVADADGHIVNRDYLIDDEDLNVRFTLQATGLSSGRTAQATFTDAVTFSGVAAGAQTPDPIAAGSSATYAITVQFNGNNTPTCSVTLSVSGLPTGAAGSFSPNPVLSPGGTDQNTTLTITTNAATTPVGSTAFTITGVGTGCAGTKTTSATLNVRRLTNTAVASAVNPSLTGQSVTFTATVTQVAGGAVVTAGSVTFIEGGTCAAPTTVRQAATAVNASGQVTFTTSALTAGSHTIVACYGGTTTFGLSSGSVIQSVNNAVDLTLSKTHSGDFDVGGAESYSLTVANAGTANTTGTVTVTDNLPNGLTFVSGTGTGWTCSAAAQVVTCTRTTAINAGANTTITLNVTVGTAAFPSVTNTASVSGGNEPAANNGNNGASDPTVVNGADLTIAKSHTGNFNVGVNGAYSISVTNSGTAATSAPLSVTDALPTGLDFVSANGGGTWSCSFNSGTNAVTCTRASNLGAGNTAPVITLTVLPNVAAVPTVTNVATVNGGNEPAANNANNSASDPTTVGTGVDLTIDKSHTGNFTQGINGTYTLTVANPGTAVTTGAITVTDNLPTGLAFVSGGGTNGWNACTAAAQVVTCIRPVANTIAAGGTAPAITLTVSVAAAAIPTVTNTASVSGGGEPAANNGNNTDSDPTTVVAAVDLTVDKSHTGNFTEGVNGVYSIVASNAGGTATTGIVTVTDVLPTGLGFVSAAGTGWTCGFASGTVTCTRTTAIAAAGSAPTITLTVSVAAAAVPSVTNTASVSGGGEPAANNGNNSDSDPTTVIAGNQAPVVEAGGPYSGNEGSAIAVAGASSNDPDAGDTPIYKWTYVANGTVDAGTSCSFSNDAIVQPTFTCNDDGAFTLTFKVDDQHGHVVQDNADVTVNNAKPTATAGGPYSGNEGSAIQLGGSGDDPAANDDDPKLTYKWTVNTTGIDAGGTCTFDDDTRKDAKITCTDDGAFKVSLVATDDDGASSDASIADLTVANVKPVAHAGGPYSGNEGSDITLTGSATDVGSNDSFTYKWTADVTGIDAGGACTFGNDTHASTTVNCTDNGAFKVKLTVTDDDGESHFEEVALSVANVDPVANAGGDYTGDEGSPVQLHGSATDVGSNDTFTWAWESLNGPSVDAGATCSFSDIHAQNPTVTCTDDGEFKLTLTVKDDNNGQDTDDAVLTLNNVKPVASAGGPYSGDEGVAIALNGSANDPGDNDDPYLTYKWAVTTTGIDAGGSCSFDDDTKKNAKVTCTDDSNGGTFTLSLVATDDDGAGSVASTASLTVLNVKPVATAGGPYSGNEGSAVALSGSADDQGDNDDAHLTYKWTINTTGIDAGGQCTFDDDTKKNAEVTCTDDSKAGTFTLSLVATDDDGASSVASTAALTVINVDPVADAGGDYTGNEGSAVHLYGSASDAGSNDTFTWSWEAINGPAVDAGATCSFSDIHAQNPTVTCTDDGEFKLTLTVKDDNNGQDSDDAILTLANVKPVANAGLPYSGYEGAAIPLNGSADDPGDNDDPYLTYKWTVNTAGIDTGGACTFDDDTKKNAQVTCTDDSNGGTFTLSLVATDDDGASSVASTTTLSVANVKPVANAGNAYSGNEGSAIQLSGSADDQGDNDDAHLTYKWTVTTAGIDGGGACSFDNDTKKDAKVTCTDDSNGGTFTLSLVATDDDNASSVASTTTLAVANLAPVAAAGTSYSGNEGSAIALNGSANDPGDNDDPYLTYKWTVNTAGIDPSGQCTFDDDTKKNAQVTCTDDSNNNTFTLTLVATDDDGASSVGSTATLTVINVKPSVATITKSDGTPLPTTIIVAGTLNIKVPFADPGSNDTQKAQIDCGEGAGYVNVNSGNNVATGFLTACTFATVGAKTVKVKVADDDGMYDEKSFGLTIKYNFDGFYAPVDRPNTMNVSKAGQAIPLKWRLTDANGAPITDLAAVTIQAKDQSCSLGVTTDQLEEYAAGSSGLQNLGNGNYQFNWKTPTTYAGSCKSVLLVFGAGGVSYVDGPYAFFSFKK